MRKVAALIIFVFLSAFAGQVKSQKLEAKKVYSEESIIQEYNERIVYSTRNIGTTMDGIPIFSNESKTIIIIGSNSGFLVNFAALEIQKYIKISTGVELEIRKDTEFNKEDYNNFLIILGNSNNNTLMKKQNIELDDYDLGDDGALIKAGNKAFSKESLVDFI